MKISAASEQIKKKNFAPLKHDNQTALVLCLDGTTGDLHGGTSRTFFSTQALIEFGYKVEIVPVKASGEPHSEIGKATEIKRLYFPLPFRRQKRLLKVIEREIGRRKFDLVLCNWPPAMAIAKKFGNRVWYDFMDDWSEFGLSEASFRSRTKKITAVMQSLLWRFRQNRIRNVKSKSNFFSAAGYSDAQRLKVNFVPTPVRSLPQNLSLKESPNGIHSRIPRIGFIGNFNYWPNRDGIRWFISEFASQIGVKFELVLAGFGSQLLDFSQPGITILGKVENQQDFYSWVDGIICPIRRGGGIKVKAIEGLVFGFQVFSTEHTHEGFPPNFLALLPEINSIKSLNLMDHDNLHISKDSQQLINDFFSEKQFQKNLDFLNLIQND